VLVFHQEFFYHDVTFQEHWHTHIHFLTHPHTHTHTHTQPPNHTLYLYASEPPFASVCNIVDTLCVSLDGHTHVFVACLHRVLIRCSHALLHVYTACHVEYSVCLLEGPKSFLVCACMCEHACTYIHRNPVLTFWVPDKWIWVSMGCWAMPPDCLAVQQCCMCLCMLNHE